ncbi:Anillin [Schistosoma japonicum]|uniref:Anillin n=1 Tax=Schistosoma japonicum TaxID=6182 RepID=A0A4Z2DKN5_SCHJA|nr:Anillin [Schistosoma japonicum]
MSSPNKAEVKETKSKLAELAKEIASWEDDLRRVPLLKEPEKTVRNSSVKFNRVRLSVSELIMFQESLADHQNLPVFARKARWERLINDDSHRTKNAVIGETTKTASSNQQLQLGKGIREKVHPVPTVCTKPDVPRGSLSHAEREKLERMKELAELRRSRRQVLPTHTNSDSALPNDSKPEKNSPNSVGKQEEDFSLPPPPSPTNILAADNSLLNSAPNTSFQNNQSVLPEVVGMCDDTAIPDANVPKDPEFTNEVNHLSSSFKEQSPNVHTVSSTSVGQTKLEEILRPTVLTTPTSTHPYYLRPKIGVKRRSSLSESSVDTSHQNIFRQKSVTFQKTTTDTTDESETDINYADDDEDCLISSEFSSQYEYLPEQEKPGNKTTQKMDYESVDSELSNFLDTILPSDEVDDLSSHSSQYQSNKENHYHSYLSKDDSDLLIKNRVSPVLPLSEAERRIQRLNDLPKLIQSECAVILQASSALQQCVSIPFRKNPEDYDRLRELGPGSRVHVEASRTMLIACQRRQVLMEELALLHRGSPVLVPPLRGDPIRARMKLSAIRLSLKTSNIPNDPTSGGGFVVVGTGREAGGWNVPTLKSRLDSQPGQPTCYHLIAVIKCRGEGRLYHSELVTLMHVSDLPIGMYRPASYVDLPAKLEIVPVRPDFVFQLEIYCMRTGSDRPMSSRAYGSPRILGTSLVYSDDNDNVASFKTPQQHKFAHSKNSTSPTPSSHKKPRYGGHSSNAELTPCETASHVLTHCLPSSYFNKATQHHKIHDIEYGNYTGRDKVAAFSLISTVEIRYHDDLLVGCVCPSIQDKPNHLISSSGSVDRNGSNINRLPLRLLHLPRSSPLAGTAGLVDAFVSLEARVLARGFMTIFEEVGGMGVWQRYWCQLRADYLHFWRYPEDEQRSHSGNTNKSKPLHPPLGRIDLRHIVTPGAVPAPRSICARANTIYMRSLREIDPNCLSASVNNAFSTSGIGNKKSSSESLVFRASTDYRWLEQKHLLCADTPQERDAWITWLNGCTESLKDWMPEHFNFLSHYDARLEFSQPVSSQLGTLLIHVSSTINVYTFNSFRIEFSIIIMSQSFVTSPSSLLPGLSSYSPISGFIQCISRKVLIKSKHTIFIKIVSNQDCFCNTVYNVIIQWSTVDEHCNSILVEKCLKFLYNCQIRCWVRVYNLKESRIYYKQNRANKVWLFLPEQSYVEILPSPRTSSNHIHECQAPPSSSLPIGLIPSINLSLVSSHCNGSLLEFERVDHHYHYLYSVKQHYLLLNVDKIVQSMDKLFYGQNINLFNVWCFFIGDNDNNNNKIIDGNQFADSYALLIPGIYSSSSSLMNITDSNLSITCSIVNFKQTIQCPGNCFNLFNEQFTKKKFSLLLHNLNYLFHFCLAYRLNGLYKEGIQFKENTLKYQDCIMSELFQHFLLTLMIQSRDINFKSYQYAEDFIQFPLISSENHQFCNLVNGVIDIHDIIPVLQSFDKFNKLNNDSKQTYTFSTSDQCIKCIQSIHCGQFIPSSSSSSSLPTSYLWDVQVCRTLIQLKLHNSPIEQYHHVLKRLTPISSPLTESSTNFTNNYSESLLCVIGKILWSTIDGCFYLQTQQKNIFPYFHHYNSYNINEKKNVISIPLIFDMITSSDEFQLLFIPADHSVVLLKGVQLIYEEYPVGSLSSSNCTDMLNSSTPTSFKSSMYLYAKQIIPFQMNHLSESIMYSKKEEHLTYSLILIHLGPLSSCYSSSPHTNPTEHSNQLLWSYVFVGKLVKNTTFNSSSSNSNGSINSNLIHLSLTGDLAYRWYYNFKIGYHYQIHFIDNLNDITISQQFNYSIGCLFNFEAMILFKQYCSLNDDWILWVTTNCAATLVESSFNSSEFHITRVYKINLHKKNTSMHNVDLILLSLMMMRSDKIVLCRFVNFSLSAIPSKSSSPSIVNLHLDYTDLSRITVMTPRDMDSILNNISTQLSDSLNISSDENNDRLILPKQPKLLISNHYDWIDGFISKGYSSNAVGDMLKECINVQATITRCLEFQIYRLSNTIGIDISQDASENDDFVNLGFCIRFIITDGSGSALVQLGNPFIMSSSSSYSRISSSNITPRIPSDNLSSLTSSKHTTELARLLLGLNSLLWKRLCRQWKRLLDRGADLSLNLYDFKNDITPECNTSVSFSSTSSMSSSILEPTSNKNNLISIKLALKAYLNSPTFLRNCRFTLKHRIKNVPRCHQLFKTAANTTETTASSSTSNERWRLKRIKLKNSHDFDNNPLQKQSVYFVLPPYRLYTLLNVISHNDDFYE